MTVWIVIDIWAYEGYSEPIGIFDSEEKANAAKATAYTGYDEVEVMKYELNKIGK